MDKELVLQKIIGMFRPYDGEAFLDYDGSQVICGPNDRAAFGCDTNFPKEWLVEDFDFTDAEAEWFIAEVRAQNEGGD